MPPLGDVNGAPIDKQIGIAHIALAAPRQFERVSWLGRDAELDIDFVPPQPVISRAVERLGPLVESNKGGGGVVVWQRSADGTKSRDELWEKVFAGEYVRPGMNRERHL